MDARRPGGEVTDSALDRELQAMLGADPSPEFVARARARVSSDAANARPWLGVWTVVAPLAAVAAVVIVIAAAGGRRGAEPGGSRAALASRPLAGSGAANAVGALLPVLRGGELGGGDATSPIGRAEMAAAHHRSIATSNAPSRTMTAAEPEVLVDPREAAALRAFFERARNGGVELTAIVAPPMPPLIDPTEVHDIYIAPIAFDPVTDGTAEKGVRQ
jgi:hypothetical protein